MQYVCPNVNCQTTWNITENVYAGGTDFHCSECNTTSQIPLYCPQCCPKNVIKKSFLNTPKGFLGGSLYNCPRGHNFRVMVSLDEAHNKLKSLGRELGQYHQGTHQKVMQNERLKNLVKGGYCAGVALDWIRRVLLGGKPTLANAEHLMGSSELKSKDEYALREKQWRQDLRGATAWETSSSEKVNPFLQSQGDRLYAWVQEKMRECNATLGESNAKFNRLNQALSNKQGLTPQQRQQLLQKIRETYDQEVADAKRLYQGQQQKYNEATAQPVMKRYWSEFARVMDEYMTRDRNGMVSSRPFTNMAVAKSVDSSILGGRSGGIVTLIDMILGDNDLKPNRAAYIGISPPDGTSGHAVAAYRLSTGGNYHFFDPNFGVYEFSRSALREAFIYIFSTAYPYWAGANTSDNHPYEVDGKTSGGYTIFAGSQAPTPVVNVPQQKTEEPKPIKAVVLAPITKLPEVKPTTTPPKSQPIAKKINTTSTSDTKPPMRPRAGAMSKPHTSSTGKSGNSSTTQETRTETPTKKGNKISELLKKFQK